MENNNAGSQNTLNSGGASSLTDFLFQSSSPDNNGRSLPENSLSQYNSPLATATQSPFHPSSSSLSHQTLDEAFSGFNLSSTREQPRYFYPGGVNSLIGGESVHGRGETDLSLENFRFSDRNRVSDDFGFGVGHGYQSVGSGRVYGLQNQNLNSVGTEMRYRDGSLTPFYHSDQWDTASYLQSKKDWSSPLLPCSSFNRSFDSPNFGFRASNFSLNSSLDQYYQQLNLSSFKDLGGIIVQLAKEKNACKILLTKLENSRGDEIDMVLSVVYKDVANLMKDEYGNLFIQKLITRCNEDQRSRIVLSITDSRFQLMFICLDRFGSECVTKLLEYLSTPRQMSLMMQALGNGAAALAVDVHGTRVIQHCLLHFCSQDCEPIINDIANNCFLVAKHRSGCCVVQTCLAHAQPEARRRMINQINANAVQLAEDPYGNYVLQHMLGLKIPDVTAELLRQLEGYYVTLSCNKFGSHVVEKCLTETGEDLSARIIMELLRSPNVSMLLLDPFGNFVIQAAISVAKGRLLHALLGLIQVNAPSLRSNLYGKKLLDRFDKKKVQKV